MNPDTGKQKVAFDNFKLFPTNNEVKIVITPFGVMVFHVKNEEGHYDHWFTSPLFLLVQGTILKQNQNNLIFFNPPPPPKKKKKKSKKKKSETDALLRGNLGVWVACFYFLSQFNLSNSLLITLQAHRLMACVYGRHNDYRHNTFV